MKNYKLSDEVPLLVATDLLDHKVLNDNSKQNGNRCEDYKEQKRKLFIAEGLPLAFQELRSRVRTRRKQLLLLR